MAETFEGLFVKFGANTVEFDNSVKGMNHALTGLKKEFKSINRELKFDPDNLEMLNKRLENLQEQARVGALKIKDLKAQQKALGDEKVGTEKWNDLNVEINKTESQMHVVNKAMEATGKHIAEVGDPKSVYNLNKALQDVGTELDQVNRMLELDPTNVDLAARRMELLGQQSDLAEQKVAALKDQQSELGDENIGTDEWKRLQYEINEAEIEAKEVQNAIDGVEKETKETADEGRNLKDALFGGVVGGLAAKAFEMAANSISNLGRQAVSANDSLAKFENTMGFAGFDESKIKDARRAVQDYADQTVYDLTDVSNTTAQLASNGISNFQELTQAAGNLNAIAGGSANTFKSVALVLTQTAGAGKLTTQNWNQLANAIPGASGKIKEAMLQNEAYTGNFNDAMAAGEITAEEFNQALLDLGSEPVAVEAAKSTKTFEGAIGNLQASVISGINNIIDAIGSENITSVISGFGNSVQFAFNIISNLLQFISKYINVIKSFTVALLAGAAAFKSYVIVLELIKYLKNYQTILNSVRNAQHLLNVTMAANPIGIWIAGITALTAALIYFFTQTETGRKALSSFVSWFTNTLNSTVNLVRNKFNSAADWYDNLLSNSLRDSINKIVNFKNSVLESINSVKSYFSNGVTSVLQYVSNIGDKIASNFNNLPSKIISAIGNLRSIGEYIIDGIINGLSNLGSRIADAIKNAISNAKGSIGNIIDNIFGRSNSESLGNLSGPAQSMYMIKTYGIVPNSQINKSSGSTNNINIRVDANNATGLDIARAIERQIVRSLSK